MTSRRSLSVAAAVAAAAIALAGCSGGGSPDATASSSQPAPLPVNSSKLLGGTATPSYPRGRAGTVDVVSTGKLSAAGGATALPVAIRNNTGQTLTAIQVNATTSANGAVTSSGSSDEVAPETLAPGEVGFTAIYFDDAASLPPAGASFTFTATGKPAGTPLYFQTLKVTQAAASDTAITGSATNAAQVTISAPYVVDAYCIDQATGTITYFATSFADAGGDLAPGAATTFTDALNGTACPDFLVGVTSYAKQS